MMFEDGGEAEKLDCYDDYAGPFKGFLPSICQTITPLLYAISLQNEPDVNVTYESCDWDVDTK